LEEKVRQRADSQKEVGRLKNEVTRGQLRCEELQEQLKKLEAENRSVRSKPLRHFFQSNLLVTYISLKREIVGEP